MTREWLDGIAWPHSSPEFNRIILSVPSSSIAIKARAPENPTVCHLWVHTSGHRSWCKNTSSKVLQRATSGTQHSSPRSKSAPHPSLHKTYWQTDCPAPHARVRSGLQRTSSSPCRYWVDSVFPDVQVLTVQPVSSILICILFFF